MTRRGLMGWMGAAATLVATQAFGLMHAVQAASRDRSKGVKAGEKMRSTPDVQLFSLVLGTQQDGSVDRPAAWWITGMWKVRVDSVENPTTLTVEVALSLSDAFELDANFVLDVEFYGSPDMIRPKAIQSAQSPRAFFRFGPKGATASNLPVYIDTGFFVFFAKSGERKWIEWIDDAVGFATTGGGSWQHPLVPLEVMARGAYWKPDLSTANGFLGVTEHALTANCLLVDAANSRRTPVAELWSPAMSFPLGALPTVAGIDFLPADASVRLPLGIENVAPPGGAAAQPAILFAARNFVLTTGWKGPATGGLALQALQIGTPDQNNPYFIECFSTPTRGGDPLTLRVADNLPLWMRPAENMLGALLLGFDNSANVQVGIETPSVIGWNPELSFGIPQSGSWRGIEALHSSPTLPVDPAIIRAAALPVIEIAGGSAEIRAQRTERRFRSAGDGHADAETANWRFTGTSLRLPIVPRSVVESAGNVVSQKYLAYVAPASGEMVADAWAVEHDAKYQEMQGSAFAAATQPSLLDFSGSPRIEAHDTTRLFGTFSIKRTLAEGEARSFDIVHRGSVADINISADFDIELQKRLYLPSPSLTPSTILRPDVSAWPLAVAKYSTDQTMKDLLELEVLPGLPNAAAAAIREHCAALFDEYLFPKSWVGLVLFAIEAATRADFQLALGNSATFLFVALTPNLSSETVYAARALRIIDIPAGGAKPEVELHPDRYSVQVFKNQIVAFDSHLSLTIRSIFGLVAVGTPIPIDASLDFQTGQLVVRASFPSGVVLLPPNPTKPVRQIRLVEAYGKFLQDGSYGLVVNAEIDFSSISVGGTAWFNMPGGGGGAVQIRDFAFGEEPPGSGTLKPKYGSIRFVSTDEHFHLLDIPGAKVRLTAVGFDIGAGQVNTHLSGFIPLLKNNAPVNGAVFIEGRLEVGALSQFSNEPGKKFSIGFLLAYGIDGSGVIDEQSYWLGATSVGVPGFDVDLYRFVKMSVRKLALGVADGLNGQIPYLDIIDANLDVLGREAVHGISARIFFGRDAAGGFVAAWTPNQGGGTTSGLGRLRWLLIGKGIRINQRVASDLLDPSPNLSTSKQISDYIDASLANGGSDFLPNRAQPGTTDFKDWMFGAGLDLAPFLAVKVLFQDGSFAGITVGEGWMRNFLGIDGLAVLYVTGSSPARDRFIIDVSVPSFEFGAFGFSGGRIRFEAGPSGDILVDLGFPWRKPNGLRAWERTMGANILPFQASGGMYLSRMQQMLPSGDEITIAGGYAVQWGVGGAASFAVARAWIRAGYFVVVEGLATLDTKTIAIRRLTLAGSVGVVVQAELSINFWIVSARISAIASAEGIVTVDYRPSPLMPPLLRGGDNAVAAGLFPALASEDLVISVDLIVGFEVTVEVTVDLWLVSKTYAVGVSLTFDAHASITV